MTDIILHQTELSLPPSFNCPPSSPYLASKTQYHNPSLSINIRHHHFPNNATLNSHNLLTPNPPSSFDKQTESQSTQAIFLVSSPPPPPLPKKNNLNNDLMEEIIHVGALKKERK